MTVQNLIFTFAAVWILAACGNSAEEQTADETPTEPEETAAVVTFEDSLLTELQRQTFGYFWQGAEPHSGMAPERIHMDGVYPQDDRHVVTTGGSGMGMMALIVGVERGFITRREAADRFVKMVHFLKNADRHHGAWPHWLDGETGETVPFSEFDDGGDLVETSFLAAGLITAREYFKDGNDEERALAAEMDSLWRGIEFEWYTRGEDVLYWHWSPAFDWKMGFKVGGYNECLIMYVLAAASPTHPIKSRVYHKGWAREGAIKSDQIYYDLELVLDHYESNDDPVGPLFWAHYSYLGLDPRGLKDKYADYWKLNQNHTLANHRYCIDNPEGYKGYGADCWGLTSSYSMRGYAAHHPVRDLGVITPTAALSSFPYTPRESLDFLKFLYHPSRDSLIGEYGPYDAFSFEYNWMVPRYLAIDQGPIPVMIENHRTGLIWNLFMQAPEVKQGLAKLGFTRE